MKGQDKGSADQRIRVRQTSASGSAAERQEPQLQIKIKSNDDCRQLRSVVGNIWKECLIVQSKFLVVAERSSRLTCGRTRAGIRTRPDMAVILQLFDHLPNSSDTIFDTAACR